MANELPPIQVVTPPVPIPTDIPMTLPPKTTLQEDETTAGQRRINLVWELTQALVALPITGAIIYAAINKIDNAQLTDAFFLIIGFYFSRTNHAAIGGTGIKPYGAYEGR